MVTSEDLQSTEYIYSPTDYPTRPTVPHVDVSFPEKPMKVVATKGEILSLKFTKYRLAAGLRPNPVGG